MYGYCMDKRKNMLVEIAEIPFEIRCRFEENLQFLNDYRTEKEPLFVIEPVQADLKRMQEEFDREAVLEGRAKQQFGDSFLENNVVHLLLAEKLVFYNVLMLHGSALCMDGEAYIFTAPSGTGKSTHSRLWREAFGERIWMINDDKPMLQIKDDGVMVFGTPWDGKHRLSRNSSAPLKAIVWLYRDEQNHIEPMSKVEAFPVLLNQAFGKTDPTIMTRVMNLEKELLDKAAYYKLGCNMESDAAVLAYKGMTTDTVRQCL